MDAELSAYKDPDIQFGEGKGNRKIGLIAFTYELGQLPAGKHKIQCQQVIPRDRVTLRMPKLKDQRSFQGMVWAASLRNADEPRVNPMTASMLSQSFPLPTTD
jgi:hypothetical protein